MQQLDSFKHREERKEWGSIHDIIKNPEKYTPEEFEKAMNEYISSNSSATEGIVTPEDRILSDIVMVVNLEIHPKILIIYEAILIVKCNRFLELMILEISKRIWRKLKIIVMIIKYHHCIS